MSVDIHIGDCATVLRTLPTGSVDLALSSPPFWRQRDYEEDGQIGIERDPREFAERLVSVMREARRVLVPKGSAFLEIGDTYAAGGNGGGGSRAKKRRKLRSLQARTGWRGPPAGYKEKDLSLAPFMVADMLRADGWYLRQVIVWNKVTATEPGRLDRPSVSHSYVFQLARRYDSFVRNPGEEWFHSSVWNIAPFGCGGGDHPAPMAPELARRLILMGCPEGGSVLDPFFGSGTTGLVADRLQRRCIGIELNPAYAAYALKRIDADRGPLLGAMEAA